MNDTNGARNDTNGARNDTNGARNDTNGASNDAIDRKAVAAEITRRAQQVAEEVTDRQFALEPQWQKYGARGRQIAVRDAAYHLSFLASAIAANEPGIYVSYVGWVRTLILGLGFLDQAALTAFTCIRDVLAARLPEGMGEVAARFAAVGIAEFEHPLRPVAAYLQDDGHPQRPLARMYLDALLRGDRHVASRLVIESVERGADLKDVYLYVLQDVQREVGRLWMTHQLTVAKEHFCTAVTQHVIAQLYPRIMATDKIGKKIVMACASGERHELGARMVADLFELEGWDAIYLGGDTPASALADAVREFTPDVVGISSNMVINFGAVQEMIEAARAADRASKLKILVGGYQFEHQEGLWKKTGADGWAEDGVKAVATANALLGQKYIPAKVLTMRGIETVQQWSKPVALIGAQRAVP